MFDASLVVQSAISAFNNAALVAPTFFWLGLLSLPLVVMAYFCGGEFLRRIGWGTDDVRPNVMNLVAAIVLIWVVTFGGNYGVLRDSVSVLPYCLGGVIFLCAVILGNAARELKLPRRGNISWGRRVIFLFFAAAVLAMVAMSGADGVVGKLIPVMALVCGAVVGRYVRRVHAGGLVWAMMLGITTLILMQPEFFRFGQLGALTVVHLGTIMLMGMALAVVAAVYMVPARGRIANSAYNKLKLMMRIVVALCVVLFLLTESVPVFLGTVAVFFAMFVLSMWHATAVPDGLRDALLGLCLVIFGVITSLPVIGALGAIIWAGVGRDADLRRGKFLL